jgi:hypothetical protein
MEEWDFCMWITLLAGGKLANGWKDSKDGAVGTGVLGGHRL